MRRASDLEQRLVEWGHEYGGGRYEENGWQGISPIVTLMTYHGPAPQGLNPGPSKSRTPADDVQDAVSALAKQGTGWLPAQVMRVEYLLPGQPMEAKLQRLRSVGSPVSRVRYYQLLRLARIHVAGWLRIPFCDEIAPQHMEAVE